MRSQLWPVTVGDFQIDHSTAEDRLPYASSTVDRHAFQHIAHLRSDDVFLTTGLRNLLHDLGYIALHRLQDEDVLAAIDRELDRGTLTVKRRPRRWGDQGPAAPEGSSPPPEPAFEPPAAPLSIATGSLRAPAQTNPPEAARANFDAWVRDLAAIFLPADRDVLEDIKAKGIVVRVYDEIYFEDPYFDGSAWTTKRFEAAGTTNGTTINLIRDSRTAENAATLYHEWIHTGQPVEMEKREREYEAYTKEERWRIDHGIAPGIRAFRSRDSQGAWVPNEAAIRAFVDEEYPGITSLAPGGGPPETIWGNTPSGGTVVQRADGTRYTRPARAGDSFPAPRPIRVPPRGRRLDIDAVLRAMPKR